MNNVQGNNYKIKERKSSRKKAKGYKQVIYRRKKNDQKRPKWENKTL